MKKKPISNRIISLLGLLLIGAIGSGLWDLFLKDFIFLLGNIFIDTYSLIYKGYVDSLYTNVGKNTDIFKILPSLTIMTVVIVSPLFFYIRISALSRNKVSNENSEPKDNLFKILIDKYFNSIIFSTLILISIIYTSVFVKMISNLEAVNYVERCTEIVRPRIENLNYIELRSEFRQIDNREKLNNIIDKLFEIASKNDIKLPECKLYGIEIYER